jgi:hypothetical protein
MRLSRESRTRNAVICRRLLPSANSGIRRVNWQTAETQGGTGLANRAHKTRALGYGCTADRLAERLEELPGELLAVESISRLPSCASLPPICRVDFVSEDRDVSASAVSLTVAPPLAKPATPPEPSPEIR